MVAGRLRTADEIDPVFGSLLAQKLGERPGLEILIDSIPGVLMFRVGLQNQRVDPEAFADEAMALIDALV